MRYRLACVARYRHGSSISIEQCFERASYIPPCFVIFPHSFQFSHICCSAACHVCIARLRHNIVMTPFAIYHQGCRDACTTTSHCVVQNAQHLDVYRHMSLCLVGDMWPPCGIRACHVSPYVTPVSMYCNVLS